jgi:hypothetical protein
VETEDFTKKLNELWVDKLPHDLRIAYFEFCLGTLKVLREKHKEHGMRHDIFSVRQCIGAALDKVSLANEYCSEENIGTSREPWKVAHLDTDGNWQGYIGAACLVYAVAKSNKDINPGPMSGDDAKKLIELDRSLKFTSKGDEKRYDLELSWSNTLNCMACFIVEGGRCGGCINVKFIEPRNNWLLCKN